MDVEESHTVVVDSGAAEKGMLEEHVSRNIHRRNGKMPKNGKGFKGPGGEHIKTYWVADHVRQDPQGI